MRHTVILAPDQEGWVTVSVPAMPGCVSQGRGRDEALRNIAEAMTAWMELEGELGRGPLEEAPAVVAAGVSEALEIIDEMRQAGELPDDHGYKLELVTVDVQQPAAV